MKSFLVIGAGHFGEHLAKKFFHLGNDVMLVDRNEELIENLSNVLTDSYVGDCRNEEVLRSLGVNNFDVCFVAIDEDFQSSLEVTSLLSELGAKHIVSTAKRDRQAHLLKKVGADEVIYAEKEIAEKTAIRFNANNVFDLIQLTDEYSIYEIPIQSAWRGHSVGEINVRQKYHVNIIAIKHDNMVSPLPGAAYVFKEGDHAVIIGKQQDVTKLTSRI
jgi:trk system potassium uptake protein TrkA